MNEDIKRLAASGAFSQFVKLMNSLELPRTEFCQNSYETAYLIGKRDGAIELKGELIDLVEKLAKET